MTETPLTDAQPQDARLDALFLIVVVLLVYGQAVTFSFSNWDDGGFITGNPVLQQGSVAELGQIWQRGTIPNEVLFIPVTYTSLWLERVWFDLAAWSVHLTNVGLHLVCVLLLWRLGGALGLPRRSALFAAIFFACHPLQVEAVGWASGRKDVLSGAFSLAALLFFVRERWALGLVCAVVAMFAKPVALVLPGCFVVLGWYRRSVLSRGTMMAVGGAGLAALGVLLLNRGGGEVPADAMPLADRLWHAPWIVSSWCAKFALIAPTLHFYEWPSTRPAIWPGLLIVLILTGGIGLFVRSRRALACLGLGFLLAAPHANVLLTYRPFVTADRYTYLFLGALALFLAHLTVRAGRRQWWALGAVLVVLAAVGHGNTRRWRSSVALWSAYTSRVNSAFSLHQLGRAYLAEHGSWHSARGYWLQAVTREPASAELYYDLGNAQAACGDHEAALSAFIEALNRRPDYVEAMVNAGRSALHGKRWEAAIGFYERALAYETPFRCEIYPGLFTALNGAEQAERLAEVKVRAAAECDGP